jgi:hypothetical protein
MNQRRTGLAVLARFPDLNDGKPQAGAGEAKGWGLLASSGRLISQGMSIKLLAGMTLFLLVGAILPFLGKDSPSANSPPANSSPAGDALLTWHPRGADTPAEAAPVQRETVATTVARRPAVRVSAIAGQSPPPATLPQAVEPKHEPQAAPRVADAGMSDWPGPARADQQPANAGLVASQANANRPAARSTEYEADARAGHRPGEPVAAKFDGNIEEPGARNRYDSTRPSIH